MRFLSFTAFALLMGSILSGFVVEQNPPETDQKKLYNVRIVYFDFFDRYVEVYADGKKILGKKLDVEQPTTGLNFVQEVSLYRNNLIRLKSNGLDVEVHIQLNEDDKYIYINPSSEPYILKSDLDMIMLN